MAGIGSIFSNIFKKAATTATEQTDHKDMELALKKSEEAARAIDKRNLEIEKIGTGLDNLTADLFQKSSALNDKLSQR